MGDQAIEFYKFREENLICFRKEHGFVSVGFVSYTDQRWGQVGNIIRENSPRETYDTIDNWCSEVKSENTNDVRRKCCPNTTIRVNKIKTRVNNTCRLPLIRQWQVMKVSFTLLIELNMTKEDLQTPKKKLILLTTSRPLVNFKISK